MLSSTGSLKLLAAIVAIFNTASGIPLASIGPRAAECSRDVLAAAADAYVAAQSAGSLDLLQKVVADKWEYEENNVRIDAKKSVLRKKLKIDHRRTIYDLVQCATYTELVITDSANPYVIGTQIRHGADGRVTLFDSVASTTGSWLFDAKKTLEYVSKETWDPIPESKWDTREHIQAAGDAYMSMWDNATAASAVPWGTPCTRVEGGAFASSCTSGIPSNNNQAPNTRRRYVIDQAMGSVNILCVWEHMMNAADSHEFRLENGKVRYIHTMTECGGRTCRL
ncbi:hypothetical protein QBC38DRAFT_462708 [Podospora fimiseda]|uniref:DUF8021 domain-containing protein n=1 Tax=Podospora fimiseda TaxID=252190 RepID=A0AAN7H609_9PEZI|nr:hypothetical protein QBC38DRAFT_462708 [Podospora fimiseda]